jgi:ACS family hexuronate transporter-like MFS transporter
MFPKSAIATITGIGGMAGGVGSFLINKGSGVLFDFTQKNWSTVNGKPLLEQYPQLVNADTAKVFLEQQATQLNTKVGNIEDLLKALSSTGNVVVNGINSGYMIIFAICSVAYLIGWVIMKSLVPKYKVITDL